MRQPDEINTDDVSTLIQSPVAGSSVEATSTPSSSALPELHWDSDSSGDSDTPLEAGPSIGLEASWRRSQRRLAEQEQEPAPALPLVGGRRGQSTTPAYLEVCLPRSLGKRQGSRIAHRG